MLDEAVLNDAFECLDTKTRERFMNNPENQLREDIAVFVSHMGYGEFVKLRLAESEVVRKAADTLLKKDWEKKIASIWPTARQMSVTIGVLNGASRAQSSGFKPNSGFVARIEELLIAAKHSAPVPVDSEHLVTS